QKCPTETKAPFLVSVQKSEKARRALVPCVATGGPGGANPPHYLPQFIYNEGAHDLPRRGGHDENRGRRPGRVERGRGAAGDGAEGGGGGAVAVPDFLTARTRGVRLTMLTAYDYTMARLLDAAGVDGLLVGDSLGMVVQGQPDCLAVTLDEVIYHTRLVARG